MLHELSTRARSFISSLTFAMSGGTPECGTFCELTRSYEVPASMGGIVGRQRRAQVRQFKPKEVERGMHERRGVPGRM